MDLVFFSKILIVGTSLLEKMGCDKKVEKPGLRGCDGNCRPGGKSWQPTAGFMTHITCASVCRCVYSVVVSGVRRMNEVNARRARLVPGWVTVFGRVYHLGM